MKPVLREYQDRDAVELAANLSPTDSAELHHLGVTDVLQEIRDSASNGAAHVVEVRTKVAAIFGVTGLPGQAGRPWMLSSTEIKRCRSLARFARQFIKQSVADHGYLSNMVWAGNKPHLAWIDWLGFEFVEVVPMNGTKFVRFEMLGGQR